MFNDESTHTERQQVLQSLMAKGAGSMGSGVHTPREINQLLARSEEEFETFQQVQVSVYSTEAAISGDTISVPASLAAVKEDPLLDKGAPAMCARRQR